MDLDYPAAHSMDASWYAIDKDGHVGLFHTGAGGAAPLVAYSPNAADVFDEIDPDELEDMGIALPDSDEVAGRLPDDKRVFVYETGRLDECLCERYERRQVPKNPLHVDELPPAVREAVGRARFDTLDFGETKIFQPVELMPCDGWDPAYLAGDGKTVKPLPGREKEYAEFVKDYRENFEQDGLTVEEPAKPKRPVRKKKKPRGKK